MKHVKSLKHEVLILTKRKQKSLRVLTDRFIEQQQAKSSVQQNQFDLNELAREMNVEKRRVNDVINVLESVCIVRKMERHYRYRWMGLDDLCVSLNRLRVRF